MAWIEDFGLLRRASAAQGWIAKLPAVFLGLFLAVIDVRAEGYTYPPEVRGDLVARLEVRVDEAANAPAGGVTLSVTVEGDENLEVAAARLDDPTDAWVARSASSWALEEDRVTWSQSFQLRQVKPGFPGLPAVTVRFRGDTEAEWEEAAWVDILSEPREAPPPEPAPREERARSLWPFAVVAALGGLIAVGWLRRRSRPTSPRSPEQQAAQDLDVIERAGLAPVELHQRLSNVVRRYLAERWQLPAPRQTTAELLERHGSQVPDAARAALAEFLRRCDLAKFAPVELTTQDCQAMAALARTLLRTCEQSKSVEQAQHANATGN